MGDYLIQNLSFLSSTQESSSKSEVVQHLSIRNFQIKCEKKAKQQKRNNIVMSAQTTKGLNVIYDRENRNCRKYEGCSPNLPKPPVRQCKRPLRKCTSKNTIKPVEITIQSGNKKWKIQPTKNSSSGCVQERICVPEHIFDILEKDNREIRYNCESDSSDCNVKKCTMTTRKCSPIRQCGYDLKVCDSDNNCSNNGDCEDSIHVIKMFPKPCTPVVAVDKCLGNGEPRPKTACRNVATEDCCKPKLKSIACECEDKYFKCNRCLMTIKTCECEDNSSTCNRCLMTNKTVCEEHQIECCTFPKKLIAHKCTATESDEKVCCQNVMVNVQPTTDVNKTTQTNESQQKCDCKKSKESIFTLLKKLMVKRSKATTKLECCSSLKVPSNLLLTAQKPPNHNIHHDKKRFTKTKPVESIEKCCCIPKSTIIFPCEKNNVAKELSETLKLLIKMETKQNHRHINNIISELCKQRDDIKKVTELYQKVLNCENGKCWKNCPCKTDEKKCERKSSKCSFCSHCPKCSKQSSTKCGKKTRNYKTKLFCTCDNRVKDVINVCEQLEQERKAQQELDIKEILCKSPCKWVNDHNVNKIRCTCDDELTKKIELASEAVQTESKKDDGEIIKACKGGQCKMEKELSPKKNCNCKCNEDTWKSKPKLQEKHNSKLDCTDNETRVVMNETKKNCSCK